MRCLLVGSGGMVPLPERFLSVVLVQLGERGYLFDCGEGTQIAMKRWHAGFRHIALLAVTHLHGDHVLGIPGFLMARANAGAEEPLAIVGPRGTQRFIQDVIRDVDFVPPYELRFIEVDPAAGPGDCAGEDRQLEARGARQGMPGERARAALGGAPRALPRGTPHEVYRDERCRLEVAPVKHNVACLGYRISEPERPGRFDAEKARRLEIPEGPLWGRLQRGEPVILDDGRQIAASSIVGPPRRGRICAVVTDTLPSPGVYRLLSGADIAFLEGMFLERDRAASAERAHLTIRAAARIARREKVQRVVLTHLSPRYRTDELELLESEAREEYSATEVGREGTWYEVPLPD
jgi:ribonuclease Z